MENLERVKSKQVLWAELEEVIEDIAKSFRETFEILVPIENMEEVVWNIGATVKKKDSGIALNGNIVIDGDSIVFEIRNDLSRNKENYILAILLGHLFIHLGSKMGTDQWDQITPDMISEILYNAAKVRQAILFAYALLMPEDQIFELMVTGQAQTVSDLAKYFHTANAMVRLRLQRIQLKELILGAER